jgi:AcrR family transcriptional regulator
MKRRKYELKKRAEREQETRLRITRATLELHETLGPALTTRSAIAKRAGVSRPTVYSHFPDELSLGKACSSLDLSENPLPDPWSWEQIANPERRLRVALSELYDYFRRREGLLANILRDQEMPHLRDDPDVREIMRPIIDHWEQMQIVLAAGWQSHTSHSRPLLHGAIGLALDFQSWRTMVRKQDMTDEQAVELMVRMVLCLTRG